MFENLTGEQIEDAERELNTAKTRLEHAKWDKELVGRCFRIIRGRYNSREERVVLFRNEEPIPIEVMDYVTLEESLAVGYGSENHVYADVVFLRIHRRDDVRLVCSGFELSHWKQDEPYIKIQPVFYSFSDFRQYLGPQRNLGSAKHCDEISQEDYETAFQTAVKNFTTEKPEVL